MSAGGKRLIKASSHCGGGADVRRGQLCTMPTAYSVQLVFILDVTVAVVRVA